MTANQTVRLRWLNGGPAGSAGVTWGIPWAEGELKREERVALLASNGQRVPVQSWPAAYWPDGSVKWSAHSASFAGGANDSYVLVKGEPEPADAPLQAKDAGDYIEVDTGGIVCRVNKTGSSAIRSINRGGTPLCADGKLVCLLEQRHRTSGSTVYREETFHGEITGAVLEQSGPVRGVIKIEGRHQAVSGARKWLPFVLRLYFYAGQIGIKAVHTFLYDGNEQQDHIKGLGMTFAVPMSGPLYNRHVRFAGDTGFFAESPKLLATLRTRGKYEDLYRRQTAGEPVSFDPQEDDRFLELLDDSAVWDEFKLVQASSDHFRISKRTKAECAWIKAGEGRRSGGLVYAGGESGGLAVGIRNFWQKHPSAMEAVGLSKDEAVLTAWFWSPDAGAMDLRHYDTETHVASSYEGFEEMRATPYGIANTNELTIWCLDRTPGQETLRAMATEAEAPSLLVCEPEHYHRTGAFGVWSLPDRSRPERAFLEERLDAVIRFYKDEIEQRRWYGFWDYGDVMHSYDPVRHVWRYDIGGCAWQNTELAPNMWLWYMFLRSGREDIFRLAEAMTRHTSEVDVYHFGPYAGLGSRHNVVHWGCGCKEARIGMAGLHRFYYYLTADERIGDIMDEVKDSDFSTVGLDPMRSYFPKDEFPTHTRVGPDWAAFSSNWMTRWERYEDTAYRDKLLVGIACIKSMPFRLLTGPVYGYDPKSGELFHFGDDNWGRHLAICMGGPQVWFELARLLKDPEWEAMMAEFGEFYLLPKEEKERRTGGAIRRGSFDHPVLCASIVAYAAHKHNDKALARQVWDILLQDRFGLEDPGDAQAVAQDYLRPLNEVPWISTNTASQWSLNVILGLELIGEALVERAEAVKS
ncbi:hypothetical protein [Paenibacillus humicola]|uniref:exo-rhamnogalacturonan lyase family protein n=1 Tax=Paenibacillus humicola TaxID=3110540 RepID=UPI00237AA51E|nr:hypothetical protein [Paenibacillus humicola]